MTVYLDTSALLRRYLPDDASPDVEEVLAADGTWVTSAVARTEIEQVLRTASTSRSEVAALRRAWLGDLDTLHLVPLDGRCLGRAAEIGAGFHLTLPDALHLAAADRLPRPVTYLTLAGSQIPAALELGFEVRPS